MSAGCRVLLLASTQGLGSYPCVGQEMSSCLLGSSAAGAMVMGSFLPRTAGWDSLAPAGPCPAACPGGNAAALCQRWPGQAQRQPPER